MWIEIIYAVFLLIVVALRWSVSELMEFPSNQEHHLYRFTRGLLYRLKSHWEILALVMCKIQVVATQTLW